jgi:hypothetical protein
MPKEPGEVQRIRGSDGEVNNARSDRVSHEAKAIEQRSILSKSG